MKHILSNKYKNPSDVQNFALGKIYLKKLSSSFFKFLFYLFSTTCGFLILYSLEYFPSSVGGRGDIVKLFEPGFPDMLYFSKPNYFDEYYLFSLAYVITDLIWLLFIYEKQSDFFMLLLHHVCTTSLITFSYLTNHSKIGCIVIYLHDLVDIFVYIVRIIINTDISSAIKLVFSLLLLVVFTYVRIFVFGNLILQMYYRITGEWHCATTCLWGFLIFLLILHFYWIYCIVKRIMLAIFENKFEDTAVVQKSAKVN